MGIKKLVCFDFDDTLCNTVKHDDGKVIWREKFGVEYPHRGWWSKPESLDMDIFRSPNCPKSQCFLLSDAILTLYKICVYI